MQFSPLASVRGDIFDRKRRPLATQQTQVVIQVVPAEMKNETTVLAGLAKVFDLQPSALKAMYSKFPRDWRTTVGVLSPDQMTANAEALNQPGVHRDTTRTVRTYPSGPSAAHLVGYAGSVDADELSRLAVQG